MLESLIVFGVPQIGGKSKQTIVVRQTKYVLIHESVQKSQNYVHLFIFWPGLFFYNKTG